MHSWRLFVTCGERLNRAMTKWRRQPVCILAKTDEVTLRSSVFEKTVLMSHVLVWKSDQ
jgi:hypothetical protein